MLEGAYKEALATYLAEGMLFEAHLDLLYQCDLACRHCYVEDRTSPRQPTEFWLDVLDQLGDMQAFSVLMSGGEITLRRDLLEIIERARRQGLFVQLKTHGGNLDGPLIARFEELGVTSVAVSYYSPRPEVHDAITRRPGSHARTLAALKRLARSKLLAFVSTSVLEGNRDDVPALVAECRELGLVVQLSGHLRAAQSGAPTPRAAGLALPERAELEELNAYRAGGFSEPRGCQDEAGLCGAGRSILYVGPTGLVTPCAAWPEPVGDLREQRLAEIWEGSPRLLKIRRAVNADRHGCHGCALRDACSFCPGQAWLESGDALGAPASLCENTFARELARARALDEPAPEPPAPLAEAQEREDG